MGQQNNTQETSCCASSLPPWVQGCWFLEISSCIHYLDVYCTSPCPGKRNTEGKKKLSYSRPYTLKAWTSFSKIFLVEYIDYPVGVARFEHNTSFFLPPTSLLTCISKFRQPGWILLHLLKNPTPGLRSLGTTVGYTRQRNHQGQIKCINSLWKE